MDLKPKQRKWRGFIVILVLVCITAGSFFFLFQDHSSNPSSPKNNSAYWEDSKVQENSLPSKTGVEIVMTQNLPLALKVTTNIAFVQEATLNIKNVTYSYNDGSVSLSFSGNVTYRLPLPPPGLPPTPSSMVNITLYYELRQEPHGSICQRGWIYMPSIFTQIGAYQTQTVSFMDRFFTINNLTPGKTYYLSFRTY